MNGSVSQKFQYLKLVARNWKSQGDRAAEIHGPLYAGLLFKEK